MRRKDKEITDRKAIDEIIDKAEVMRIGLSKDKEPYVVPLCFGYDGKAIYFHSAGEGMKIEYIKNNPKVCFEMETGVSIVKHDSIPCGFTFAFRSVIGFGEVSEMAGIDEKRDALNIILRHYSDKEWHIPDIGIQHVKLWKISIDSIFGKKSGD